MTNKALLVSMEKLGEEEKKSAELRLELGKKQGEVEELKAGVAVGGKEELAQLRAELAVEREELALVKAQLMGERQESVRLWGEVEGAEKKFKAYRASAACRREAVEEIMRSEDYMNALSAAFRDGVRTSLQVIKDRNLWPAELDAESFVDEVLAEVAEEEGYSSEEED